MTQADEALEPSFREAMHLDAGVQRNRYAGLLRPEIESLFNALDARGTPRDPALPRSFLEGGERQLAEISEPAPEPD